MNNNQIPNEAASIHGLIDRVVYESENDGYCVLKIINDQKSSITLVGHCAHPQIGQSIKAQGTWIENAQYGKQFKADHLTLTLPKTKQAISDYLSSGVIRGIGKQTAQLLVKHFGTNTLDILSNSPENLQSVPGIGKKKSQQIQKSWQEQQGASDVLIFLQGHQIGPARAIKIYKRYGHDAITTIQKNPYILYRDIPGIGFHLADKIAQSMGLKKDHPQRVRHGLFYQLDELASQGHTTSETEQLIEQVSELLKVNNQLVIEQLQACIDDQSLRQTIEQQVSHTSLTSLRQCEESIAEKLVELCNHPSHLPPHSKIRTHMDQLDDTLGYQLSEGQIKALQTILSNKVCVLTGGPGVGKTTLVQSVVHILRKCHVQFQLCAPTGRAAKRLKESTGHEAKTIHRVLGIDPISKQFQHNAKDPLKTEYCIVDECSMLDVNLTQNLLSALPKHCGLLLVGDVDQLPSVGPGNVLGDVIELKRVPVVQLTEIFRQAQTSLIVRHSHRVREGTIPNFDVSDKDTLQDCYGIFVDETESIGQKIETMICERIPKRFKLDPLRDIQVLCPMQKGSLGTIAFNKRLQQSVNHAPVLFQNAQITLKQFDKVMQRRNNYEKEVFNGDIGYVEGHQAEKQIVSIRFDDKIVDYFYDELDEITLAYAMTIHKSQGSEFKAVIIPLTGEHYVMLERNLLYTAMTRAKKLLIMIGDKKSLRIAVQKQTAKTRNTMLRSLLNESFLRQTLQ